jgi:tetratricopeptide (TPR) repeat protein
LSLSGDYLGAAAIYEACSAQFPDDDYSLHYAAWNRWQAGERTTTLIAKYQEAVSRNPTNPWWNQRHLAALITLGQFDLARREWRTALNRIDPDGQQAESPWLFENLHVPVASAWNRVRCWHDALKTLGAPGKRFAHHREVKELTEQIAQTEAQVWSQLYGWLAAHSDPRWRQARTLVDKLRDQVGSLPVPSATTGEDDAPVLEWSLDDAVVVLEFGSAELLWSASDRKRPSDGGELTGNSLPPNLINWLNRISRV